jgi:hypothetical protein
MKDFWTILQLDWRDLMDILLVSILFYQVYRMMKGTRAVPMFVGLLLLFFVYVVVQLLDLTLVSLIFREFTTVWAIAIVILFQPELRRFLIQMGNNPIFSRIFQIRTTGLYEIVADSAQELSRRQYGGLFVLLRDVGLRAIVETGVKLQAELTKETLVTIFFPAHAPARRGRDDLRLDHPGGQMPAAPVEQSGPGCDHGHPAPGGHRCHGGVGRRGGGGLRGDGPDQPGRGRRADPGQRSHHPGLHPAGPDGAPQMSTPARAGTAR